MSIKHIIFSAFVLVFCVPNVSAETFHTASGKQVSKQDIDNLINQFMKENKVPGLSFALINEGKLAYTYEYGAKNADTGEPVTRNTVFEAASISKAVFAYYTLKMAESGVIDLDEPLWNTQKHSDLTNQPLAQLITPRMVLTHSSGLPNWHFLTEDGTLSILHKPGEDYSYSGEAFEYLAQVIAKKLDTDFVGLNAHIDENVLKPLGMQSTSFILSSAIKANKANGHEEGQVNGDLSLGFAQYFGSAYGLHTTAEHFSPFLIALIDSRVLAKNTTSLLFTPATPLPEDDSLNADFGFDAFSHGLLVGNTKYGKKYAHGGINAGFQCYFMVIPEQKFGFVFFGNSDTAIALVGELETFLLD